MEAQNPQKRQSTTVKLFKFSQKDSCIKKSDGRYELTPQAFDMRFQDCKYTKHFFLTTDRKGIKCKICANQIRAINASPFQFVRHIRIYHPQFLEGQKDILKSIEDQQRKQQAALDQQYMVAARQIKTFVKDPQNKQMMSFIVGSDILSSTKTNFTREKIPNEMGVWTTVVEEVFGLRK